jgi:flagellar FliJ protein
MNDFDFPLARIRKLRKDEEDVQAAELAEARNRADEARRAREDLQAIRDANRSILGRSHGAQNAGHLRNLEYVLEGLDRQIADANDSCLEAEEELVRSMDAFARARNRRRVLDQLRERRLADWQEALKREEQKINDEIALGRHGKRDHVAGM